MGWSHRVWLEGGVFPPPRVSPPPLSLSLSLGEQSGGALHTWRRNDCVRLDPRPRLLWSRVWWSCGELCGARGRRGWGARASSKSSGSGVSGGCTEVFFSSSSLDSLFSVERSSAHTWEGETRGRPP
jgi:hypothetical protein